MRADRLIALVMLLQARGRMTAAELAERLEVTPRTIYRDLDALSTAGVPVYAERGTGGGIELPDGYRLDLTALNREEASALFLSAAPGPLADLGGGLVLEVALHKLAAALPLSMRREAERARERLHVDPAEWWRTPETVPHLATIQDAVWRDRRLLLTYQRPGRPPSEQVVEPYGLVAKASIWYVVAAVVPDPDVATDPPDGEWSKVSAADGGSPSNDRPAAGRSDVRVYRVSRVQAAELAPETCRRPLGFDLPSFWNAWCAEFERTRPSYSVVLRVQPALVPALRGIFGDGIGRQIARHGTIEADGSLVLPLTFESEEIARARLLGLAPAVEVLSPADLRARMAHQAAAISALYGGAAPEAEPSTG